MNLTAATIPIAHVLAIATIVVACTYLALGFDDLCGDLAFWIRATYRKIISIRKRYPRLTVEMLRAKPQQRIAIMIPCWHEAGILGPMLEFACTSIDYDNFDIFVGVYPNDEETVREVRAAAKRSRRVHPVINEKPGPTTKAQNLNQMFTAIEQAETEEHNPYAIIVLHDVEDVIHPLSLRTYNYLMPRFDMVQLPVLPLERPWHEWTSWTYVDEFAENHLKDLVLREAMGSFVPCAGVGCAFDRAALRAIGDEELEIFPSHTITEDYQTALKLRLRGFSTILVHQRLGTQRQKYSTAASYVATRAYFPDHLSTAVRQKSRWVAGICLQAWQAIGWRGNAATRYALYRDRKGIATNLFALCGYCVIAPVLLLAIWHHFDARVAVASISGWWVWPMLDVVLFLTLWRLLQKAIFVSAVYGARQGLLSVLRQPWGAIINGLATIRALTLFFKALRERREMSWNKTAHVFPTNTVLREFRRQLGDVLVDHGKIDQGQLDHALAEQREGERLGETLIRLAFVQPRDIVQAVAYQHGIPDAIHNDLIVEPAARALIPENVARDFGLVPLRIAEDGDLEVATADVLERGQLAALREIAGTPLAAFLVERERVLAAIDRAYAHDGTPQLPIGSWLVERGYLEREQLDLVLAQPANGRKLFERLTDSKLLGQSAIDATQRDYFGARAQAA